MNQKFLDLRKAMWAPSSGGKFKRTEFMGLIAIEEKFISYAFCKTFLKTKIENKMDSQD